MEFLGVLNCTLVFFVKEVCVSECVCVCVIMSRAVRQSRLRESKHYLVETETAEKVRAEQDGAERRSGFKGKQTRFWDRWGKEAGVWAQRKMHSDTTVHETLGRHVWLMPASLIFQIISLMSRFEGRVHFFSPTFSQKALWALLEHIVQELRGFGKMGLSWTEFFQWFAALEEWAKQSRGSLLSSFFLSHNNLEDGKTLKRAGERKMISPG